MEEMYLVWSNEHRAFWGEDRSGYVNDHRKAGRYTLAEATDICRDASYGSVNVPNETMLPEGCAPKSP